MKKLFPLLLSVCVAACATTTTTARPATAAAQRPPVRGEEFHVRAEVPGSAGDAYDATLLFDRATQAVRDHRCEEAVADFDRLIREYPDNRRVHPAQFNRGLCLQQMNRAPEAADAMRAAAAAPRDPELTRDAWFRVAVLGEASQRPAWVVEATSALLDRPQLSLADRVEALARRAAALLAQSDRDGAERFAQQAIAIAPTPEAVAALGDDTYAAEARVILGEVTRARASEVVYRVEESLAEEAITRLVGLVTHAHVQFNDAIRVGNPHWAAAAGFRIGEVYRDLYNTIVNAPLPADWDEHAREIYRRRTGDRLRPVLQGALRSWEATLAMARRNGISDNEWVRRASAAIDDLRALVLGDPAPGSARPAPPTPTPAPAPPTSAPPTVRPTA